MLRWKKAAIVRTNFCSSTVAFTIIIIVLCSSSFTSAAVPCADDGTCHELVHPNSSCDGSTNTCLNPFASGCLNAYDPELYEKRVCNSDDDHRSDACIIPDELMDYFEIRIVPGNWESSIMTSWVLQILLSELLHVPCTIEAGGVDESTGMERKSSFYELDNSWDYVPWVYNFDALYEAGSRGGNCLNSDKPCGHVMPEVNQDQTMIYTGEEENQFDPSSGTGYIGSLLFSVSQHTLENNPALGNHYGLRGEENRALLADTFRTPVTWAEYCSLSLDYEVCNEGDTVAQRLPANEEESNSYFVEDSYTGYFHLADENNCEVNPNCTGHFVNSPCEWSVFVEQQLYWNEIFLESRGRLEPNNGYTYTEMVQLMKASALTKSNMMMVWWEPEPLPNKYNFTRVTLPNVTPECLESRITAEERCSSDVSVRRGNKVGSCDYVQRPVVKVVSSTLTHLTNVEPEETRSPGLVAVNSFVLNVQDMDSMLNHWINRGVDKGGYDLRDAVCSWAYDHVDDLSRYIPDGYPRVIVPSSFQAIFTRASTIIAVLVCVAICLTEFYTKKYRETKPMKRAQVTFLELNLFGFLLLALGAALTTADPTLGICTASSWLVNVGYTLSLTPLLVKIYAINKISHKSRKVRRVTMNVVNLYVCVGATVGVVIVYLIVWTSMDPLTLQTEVELENENEITVYEKCGSYSKVWELMSFVWRFILLLVCAVLAIQSRQVVRQFNDAVYVATMCYSRFIFFVVFLISNYRPAKTNQKASILSVIYSIDILTTIVIYFLPKFFEARECVRKSIARQTRLSSSKKMVSSIRRLEGDYEAERNGTDSVNVPNESPKTFVRRMSFIALGKQDSIAEIEYEDGSRRTSSDNQNENMNTDEGGSTMSIINFDTTSSPMETRS